MQREPVAAGRFYPAEPKRLEKEVNALFFRETRRPAAEAAICPHAGYPFSGRLAAKSIFSLKKSDSVVLLGTSHSGLGKPFSVSEASHWKTPLGLMEIDSRLADNIVDCTGAEFDELGHEGEHSIEVQLPFFQCLHQKMKIVPITVVESGLSELLEFGKKLAKCIENAAVIASGDFSHYVPLKTARERDLEAIKFIKGLEAEKFHSVVKEKRLSICGVSPFTALLQYCREKGLEGKLLEYSTSAETTKDKCAVVGYASIVFGKKAKKSPKA